MAEYADRPSDKKELEEGIYLSPKFDDNGLIPVVTTDHETNEVLMQAYMNAETLKMTIELGEAVYYSRSRQEIWHKGKTSGNVQKVKQILTDCDQDCIVLKVEIEGINASCHTGRYSCFYREIPFGENANQVLGLNSIDDEKHFDPEKVYGKK